MPKIFIVTKYKEDCYGEEHELKIVYAASTYAKAFDFIKEDIILVNCNLKKGEYEECQAAEDLDTVTTITWRRVRLVYWIKELPGIDIEEY